MTVSFPSRNQLQQEQSRAERSAAPKMADVEAITQLPSPAGGDSSPRSKTWNRRAIKRMQSAPMKVVFDDAPAPDDLTKRAYMMGFVMQMEGDKDNFALFRACFSEFLATLVFLFINVTAISYLSSLPDSAGKMLMIGLNFGLSIFVLIYGFGPISGGHINPAVTLCMTAGKRVSIMRGLLYVSMQLVGAVVGSAIAKGISIQSSYDAVRGGANIVSPAVDTGSAFVGEMMMTLLLCLIVLAATNGELGNSSGFMRPLLPYAIGIAVFLGHMVLIPIDGCSINPARSFGAAAVANEWSKQWLFWIAPSTGSIAALIIWECILRPPIPVT